MTEPASLGGSPLTKLLFKCPLSPYKGPLLRFFFFQFFFCFLGRRFLGCRFLGRCFLGRRSSFSIHPAMGRDRTHLSLPVTQKNQSGRSEGHDVWQSEGLKSALSRVTPPSNLALSVGQVVGCVKMTDFSTRILLCLAMKSILVIFYPIKKLFHK